MRKIECKKCGKHLGEIRDAKLSKGLVTLCSSCYTANHNEEGGSSSQESFMDMFNSVLGGKK